MRGTEDYDSPDERSDEVRVLGLEGQSSAMSDRTALYFTDKQHFSCSKSEITTFCEEFSNCDGEMISSFVESCLEDDQGPNADWTKTQWLQRLRNHFEDDGNYLDLGEINSYLNAMVRNATMNIRTAEIIRSSISDSILRWPISHRLLTR